MAHPAPSTGRPSADSTAGSPRCNSCGCRQTQRLRLAFRRRPRASSARLPFATRRSAGLLQSGDPQWPGWTRPQPSRCLLQQPDDADASTEQHHAAVRGRLVRIDPGEIPDRDPRRHAVVRHAHDEGLVTEHAGLLPEPPDPRSRGQSTTTSLETTLHGPLARSAFTDRTRIVYVPAALLDQRNDVLRARSSERSPSRTPSCSRSTS